MKAIKRVIDISGVVNAAVTDTRLYTGVDHTWELLTHLGQNSPRA